MEANNKAMRDALIRIGELTTPCEGVTSIELQVNGIACAALAKPPRNCDVGTAEEQSERFDAFCRRTHCQECPHDVAPSCELSWAQMPYEKGGAK